MHRCEQRLTGSILERDKMPIQESVMGMRYTHHSLAHTCMCVCVCACALVCVRARVCVCFSVFVSGVAYMVQRKFREAALQFQQLKAQPLEETKVGRLCRHGHVRSDV